MDLDSPDSLDVVVNKQRPLDPIDHAPADLMTPDGLNNPSGEQVRPELDAPLRALTADARGQGLDLTLVSGYRSHEEQAAIYGQKQAERGTEQADSISARPGFSEHQTGLAVDLARPDGQCTLMPCFGETAEGRWLAENAWRHGFILRYPADQTPIVGYAYEPWHFRYVGVETATAMHDRGIATLEEYRGLTPAPSYI